MLTSFISPAIPQFEPTSSPKLDEMILEFREKLFLPWALNKQQRKLIWSPKKSAVLENEPGITVEMDDGERVKLTPADPYSIPEPRREIHKMLELMKEPEDWKIVPHFLGGLKMSHKKLLPKLVEKLVRKAHESGQIGVMIRCAELHDKTGFSLRDPVIFKEFLLASHKRAANVEFKGEQVDKALKQAERVIFMLGAKEHKPALKPDEIDPRRRPETVGILLELAAARAANNLGGVDENGAVEDYVTKVLALWVNGDYSKKDHWRDASKQVESLTPLWNGLRESLRVDSVREGKYAGLVKKQIEELDRVLKEAKAVIEAEAGDKKTRGVEFYEMARQTSPS